MRLSVTFAVNWYEPAATLVQVSVYGAWVTAPSVTAPWRKATCETLALVADACTPIVILEPTKNVPLLAGAVMEIDGAL